MLFKVCTYSLKCCSQNQEHVLYYPLIQNVKSPGSKFPHKCAHFVDKVVSINTIFPWEVAHASVEPSFVCKPGLEMSPPLFITVRLPGLVPSSMYRDQTKSCAHWHTNMKLCCVFRASPPGLPLSHFLPGARKQRCYGNCI